MFYKHMYRFILYLILFRAFPLYAQDTIRKWDLQTCLDYAKQNNITLNSLRLSNRTAEQNLLLSQSAVLPNLSASVSPTLTHSKFTDNNGNLKSGFTPSLNTSASSSVTLFNGGYLKNDIRQKDLLVKVADLDLQAAENDITLQITQAYLNILVAKENIVYVQDVVTTSEAQLQQEQLFFDAGTVARKDLVQIQAQLANDRYTLVTAKNAHRQNILTLKQLLQLPTDTTFEVVEPDTLMATALSPLRDVQQYALANRPEVKSSELNMEAAQIELQKVRAGYLPVLTAGASLGSNFGNNTYYSYVRQLDNNFYQQIGVTLSVPIFSRRANRINEARSQLEVGQAQLTLQNTRTQLSQEIEQAYINVENAQAQYDAAVEQLRYTQESYRIANEQLRIGAANTVEVLQQKNLYVQSVQSYIQAKYSAALYIRIYDFYRGIPVKL